MPRMRPLAAPARDRSSRRTTPNLGRATTRCSPSREGPCHHRRLAPAVGTGGWHRRLAPTRTPRRTTATNRPTPAVTHAAPNTRTTAGHQSAGERQRHTIVALRDGWRGVRGWLVCRPRCTMRATRAIRRIVTPSPNQTPKLRWWWFPSARPLPFAATKA
jgi:hypothetical protein